MDEAPDDELLGYQNSDSDHAVQQQGVEDNDEDNDAEDDPDRALFMSLTGGMSSVPLFWHVSNDWYVQTTVRSLVVCIAVTFVTTL